MSEKPETVYLKDYKAPAYSISDVFLTFDLDDNATLVTSEMRVFRNKNVSTTDLELVGEQLKFVSAKLDGKDLDTKRFQVNDLGFKLIGPPESFTLTIQNKIDPASNKALEGLYKSSGIFCTQNEPEGFRRITYFIDRPDVMAKFKTKIIANKKNYPVLLSNGNLVESGDLAEGKHFCMWQDPFAKPSYLFALVAGDLGVVKDKFVTMKNRKIDLFIYSDKGNESKCLYAMEALKRSMKWDEERFGLEYDLECYMIVAVDSFNMGAMENKGLNVFNSAYVLADAKTATDDNFMGVEAVIGHEYFHNWTGNRVTCRDWFQLTLKEGLTVFRDQEFSSDLHSRAVERIDNIDKLKTRQFIEDAGPNAHPIRPASYMEINNFYTMTVYEKGSEVIRMIHTILGETGFQKGMKKYFELFDGKAVTTDDFLYAMSSANGYDFEHFINWYNQAGTPVVDVQMDYNESSKTIKLTLAQSCPATPGQETKLPFFIPFKIGLLDQSGKDIKLTLKGDVNSRRLRSSDGVLFLRDQKESFEFENIKSRPVLSLNREFSAPVIVKHDYLDQELAFLAAHDSNEYTRFNAIRTLAIKEINKIIDSTNGQESWPIDKIYLNAYKAVLEDKKIDMSFKARALSIPTVEELFNSQAVLKVDETYRARKLLKNAIGTALKDILVTMYKQLSTPTKYQFCKEQVGNREVKAQVLSLIIASDEELGINLALAQFDSADNMTDEASALAEIIFSSSSKKDIPIKKFYAKWKDNTLVIQKWLALQASAPLDTTLKRVMELEKDPVYDAKVPNLLRSVVGAFSKNGYCFHRKDGSGYKFIADRIIEIDKLNPSMGAALSSSFVLYKKFPANLKTLAEKELRRIVETAGLSKNAFEIVSKTLNA